VTAKWFLSLILTVLFGFQAHGVMNQSLGTDSLVDSSREIHVPPSFMEGEDASILLEGKYDAADKVSLADRPLVTTSDEVAIVDIRSSGNHLNSYLENLY